jgi:hypothetical protein
MVFLYTMVMSLCVIGFYYALIRAIVLLNKQHAPMQVQYGSEKYFREKKYVRNFLGSKKQRRRYKMRYKSISALSPQSGFALDDKIISRIEDFIAFVTAAADASSYKGI